MSEIETNSISESFLSLSSYNIIVENINNRLLFAVWEK